MMRSKRFIIITIIEIVIIGFIIVDLFFMPANNEPAEERLSNSQTEANLPVIGKREYYDAVFLGTSHARIFSRFENHARVEKVLGKKIINLGQGYERGGAKSQQTYLNYFYERGNFATTLVYFVDPFIFYRRNLDENVSIYVNEPYRHDFSNILKDVETNKEIVAFYETKTAKGIRPTRYPEFEKKYQGNVSNITPESINERIAYLYKDQYNKEQFDKTFRTLMETIEIARGRGMKVIVIIPTTQLPTQPQDKYVLDALRAEAKKGLFAFYDFSHVITDPSLFYDTDHLNTPGIMYFTQKHLKPLLDK
ncbi:hypothetical protein KAZ66_02175 [Candidatus Woesebacteria bacterium]|nr:hypothetical protein [Candidatus Woesebacteria bacterium]